MKMNQLCLCFCLTESALSSLKNIRESRNPVQLLRAASHLLYTYYFQQNIWNLFTPSWWKREVEKEKFFPRSPSRSAVCSTWWEKKRWPIGCPMAEIKFSNFSTERIIFTSRNKTLQTFYPSEHSVSRLPPIFQSYQNLLYNEKMGGKCWVNCKQRWSTFSKFQQPREVNPTISWMKMMFLVSSESTHGVYLLFQKVIGSKLN